VVFIENVKGLKIHDKGRTLETMLNVLRNDLGYFVPEPQILNAKNFGLAQNRERIFIVAFREDVDASYFAFPHTNGKKAVIRDIMEEKEVSAKYYLSETYLNTLIAHKARHESKGNGFGYEIKSLDSIANAIVVGGMGRERNLIIDKRLSDFTPVTKIKGEINKQFIRKMTPRECARLQGFPDSFRILVADVHAYKQFGNTVAIPVVETVAEIISEVLTCNEKVCVCL
jgi:DNA (cytosine-5)-methyltransferase 1